MKTIRLIPRLDVKGPNLVKGVHLEGLRVLGHPNDFAKHYYQNGADELLYSDPVASLFERNSLFDVISATAKKIFIPITVAGGIRTLEDIKNILRAGADKVSLNTAVIKNPALIKKASRKFGSSTIVVTIEAIREGGEYMAYTDNGRESTGIEVVGWAKKVASLGAGEIIITSVDKEGTGKGFDIELVKMVSEAVNIPVIAHGGAGSPQDIVDVVKVGKADAVSIASLIHYGVVNRKKFVGDSVEGNTEFLRAQKISKKISSYELQDLKKYLIDNDIQCRYP
ncbi:imidazole glycerol phosphate synthase cyclase subunit [Akkermansiaceae bacterium]|nr:imidazole glycerol phosphate synthase cyclase subunit [Akkermansiaceae bacterium]MDC0291154.1 imidazole glycerol phosphate synthase cyclase subunit [Akkermansiaceae bacterium]